IVRGLEASLDPHDELAGSLAVRLAEDPLDHLLAHPELAHLRRVRLPPQELLGARIVPAIARIAPLGEVDQRAQRLASGVVGRHGAEVYNARRFAMPLP